MSRRPRTRKSLLERYGPWALVAGGSQGLGASFAEALAAGGFGLVLAARGASKLAATAGRLRGEYGTEVREVVLDLGAPGAARHLENETRGLDLGLLVCNAAASHTGGFLGAEPEIYRRILEVNCRGSLELCHTFGRRLVARGGGGIILMSSLAGFQGAPWVAVYGASKAFLISLGEALGEELGRRGVDVTVACPGPVLTPGYLASKPGPSRPKAMEMAPEAVVRSALRALGSRRLVIPGLLNRGARAFMSLLPRRAAVAMLGRSTGRMYAER